MRFSKPGLKRGPFHGGRNPSFTEYFLNRGGSVGALLVFTGHLLIELSLIFCATSPGSTFIILFSQFPLPHRHLPDLHRFSPEALDLPDVHEVCPEALWIRILLKKLREKSDNSTICIPLFNDSFLINYNFQAQSSLALVL